VAGHGAAHDHEGERDSPDRRPSSRSLEPPTGELPPQIRSRLFVRARFRFRGLGAGCPRNFRVMPYCHFEVPGVSRSRACPGIDEVVALEPGGGNFDVSFGFRTVDSWA
jgi:hypothetical protein